MRKLKFVHLYMHCLFSNTVSYHTYRFAFQRAEPPIDESQDITVISASHIVGNTTIIFNRPRNSGDSNDISLDACRFFLFAFGGLANFATQAAGYHFSNRFISPERICIPTFAECSGKDMPQE